MRALVGRGARITHTRGLELRILERLHAPFAHFRRQLLAIHQEHQSYNFV